MRQFFIVLFLLIPGFAFGQYVREVSVIRTYTTSGTTNITNLNDITGFDANSEIFAVASVDILIVGGGGGGGGGLAAGGGGGGEVKVINIDLNLGASLTINIGAGGRGALNSNQRGGSGSNTVVTLNSGTFAGNYIALGGGGGGRTSAQPDGLLGGSGGGGGARLSPASQAGPGAGGGSSFGIGGGTSYLNPGSNGFFNPSNPTSAAGGGGGGAGSTGTSGTSSGAGGNGGQGISLPQFTGRYGAGGGANGTTSRGSGGLGGGGNGSTGVGGNGSPNTGSGGGGGGTNGGDGADGIVIVQIIYRLLPVEFSKFDVTYQPKLRSSKISWETAKEWENSHFSIERAVSSVSNWETVGRVEGQGYSDGFVEYSFQDRDIPLAGGNIFYRLKQNDFNGDFAYSETRAIKVEPVPGVTHWRAYPNPTSGDPFNIEILDPSAYRDEPITLRVIAPSGQYEFIPVLEIRNMGAQVSDYFRGKAAGVYTIEISWGENREYHKVILRR
ncbi:glycine-rich domain-containing protein [Algoriphagus namhaensis]|uniref:Glycine-rich domain-containing protein n=1 Tax=Algoriphagus namhaensis TaxID=915353 RepID=A0ABV8APW7_9BACT